MCKINECLLLLPIISHLVTGLSGFSSTFRKNDFKSLHIITNNYSTYHVQIQRQTCLQVHCYKTIILRLPRELMFQFVASVSLES